MYRYLHQPGEQHGDQKKRATDFIWSKYTYQLDQIVQEPSNRVLYYLQDGPDRAFMREELMHVSEDTQVPPDWVKTITHHFCNPLAGYKKILLKEPEIKKMSMFRQQVQMADDDEFDHIAKNSQRVLKLNDQYENHPYAEEFTKECNVMFIYGTYVLEGEADAKFSLGDIWKLFQEYLLPNNASNYCR